ncbi:MAG TPA: hypothetical protein VHE33_12935 [Acidobacteriaceae bacterium]|nr:hypothetical protein [Acidobacteriaceae bacterium]
MSRTAFIFVCMLSAMALPAVGQDGSLDVPKSVVAGTAFSIQAPGSGKGTLYIAGPGGALKRDVQLGQPIAIAASDLNSAGHYVAVLSTDSSSQTAQFDVVPASDPAAISFLARPSRLPVNLQNGITGAVYLFDSYRNLITSPVPVSFQLAVGSAPAQSRTVTTKEGAAWTGMNSATKEGNAKFMAQAGSVSATRVIEQVPGEPCGLKMNAHKIGDKLNLVTDPLRDCSGNAVSDGTVVTFTETWQGGQTTVDVPLKRDIAEAMVPAHVGARLSVATGTVMGNEIRWEGQE